MLPHASTAVHVLVVLYSLAHEPGVVASAEVSVTLLTASDAVGVENTGVAGHPIVAPGPTPLITGGVTSIVKVAGSEVVVEPQFLLIIT